MELAALKVELKEWEHSFFAKNKRQPGKHDIKADKEVSAKYKLYSKLKSQPEKEIPVQLQTPEKSLIESSPVKELGPTPQIQGRVLSIFDIITESPTKSILPELTPLKLEVQKSPTKFDTPAYFKASAVSFSPSPLFQSKSLVSLQSELEALQEESEEEYEAPQLDQQITNEIEEAKDMIFKKRPKRTTRRHVFKVAAGTVEEKMPDLKEEMKKTLEKPEVSESEEEDDYQPSNKKPKTSYGMTVLSSNYKRLKLRKKGRWGRR